MYNNNKRKISLEIIKTKKIFNHKDNKYNIPE